MQSKGKLTNNQLLLKEIISQESSENNQFDSPDTFFEFFSASQILKNYAFSDEELENGLIGGGNDGGCDAAYVLLNDEIITSDQIDSLDCSKGASLKFIIFQSKNQLGFGEDPIMKWKTISENLLEMSNDMSQYENRYSSGVIGIFMLFREAMTKLVTKQPKVSFEYYYVTLGTNVHTNTLAQAEELKSIVRKKYPSARISVEFVTADKLFDLYNSEPDNNVVVTLADQPITLGKQNEFVTLINLADYYRFITDSSSNLRRGIFESNVRDYQGGNSVNTCIANTLRNKNSADFWWFNNGITILSDKITLITSKKLSIDNPAIVNGLQTSREIYNYFSENKNKLDEEDRNLLVRFIVPDSDKIRDDVIFATNNQTNIPKSSLRVTDAIHAQIEIYCKTKGLYYDRRKNYYKNQKVKATDIISVSFLAQCLISLFLKKPDIARARPSTLLTDDKTYDQLYSRSWKLDVYYKVGKLGKLIQNNLRKSAQWSSSERNDILFYVLYGVVIKLLGQTDIKPTDIENFDLNLVSEKLIDSVKEKIYLKYKELGGNGSVSKDPFFIHQIDKLMEVSEKQDHT